MPTSPYSRVIRAFLSEAWAIQPEKLEAMIEVLALRAAGMRFTEEEIEARTGKAGRQPYQPSQGGAIAVLPMRGVLSNRASMVGDMSTPRGTSAEQLGNDFRTAVDDPSIEAIVFDVDSPGGAVSGIAELAADIYRARGSKPIIASVNALSASAAYWLTSATDEIVVTPSGMVGSIGVYTVHQDVSAAAEAAGVKTTIIKAGKYKTEANPHEPLGEDAQAAIQSMVDEYYGMFVDAVAQGRGVKASEVKGGFGQGRTVTAKQAVQLGMADRIGTLNDVLKGLGASSSPAKITATQETPAPRGDLHAMRRRQLEIMRLAR